MKIDPIDIEEASSLAKSIINKLDAASLDAEQLLRENRLSERRRIISEWWWSKRNVTHTTSSLP